MWQENVPMKALMIETDIVRDAVTLFAMSFALPITLFCCAAIQVVGLQ